MTAAYVQQVNNGPANDSSTTRASGNFPAANTAGNLIFYFILYDANGNGGAEPTIALSDTLGNTYVKIKSTFDAGNLFKCEIGYAKNIAAGTNSVTATFGGSLGSTSYKGIMVAEYSGLDTTAPFTSGEDNGQQQQSANSVVTDSLTSGNTPTLSTQPALVVGVSSVLHNTNGAPLIGTGYTANGGVFWQFGTGGFFGQLESKRVTATTAVAATFTPPVTEDAPFASFVAVFKEPSSSGAALAATVGDVVTVTGALSTGIKLAAAATDVVTVGASLSTAIQLAATAADVVTVSATLLGTGAALAASASDVVTVTASLSTAIQLAATPADVVTVSATLTGTGAALAAAASDVVTVSGTLSGSAAALAAAPADVVTVTAGLSTGINLAASIACVTTVTANLPVSAALAANVSCIVTVFATLPSNLPPFRCPRGWTADATYITADGNYTASSLIPSTQWTADGCVASRDFTGPMPNFIGLTYYQACAICYPNTWVPLPPVYVSVNNVNLEGVVVAQYPAVGVTITNNTVLTFSVARSPNPYLIVATRDLTV